jgi:hypothetical protein
MENQMRIRSIIVSVCALTLSLMQAQAATWRGCYQNGLYICHFGSSWNGLCVWKQDYETNGYVNRAAAIEHGNGFTGVYYADAECSYDIITYDGAGTATTTHVPGDLLQASYTTGDACSNE